LPPGKRVAQLIAQRGE